MNVHKGGRGWRTLPLTILVALVSLSRWTLAGAFQSADDIQERVNEIKESAARSKQTLAQYRWRQQETVTVKGKVSKQDLFQVEPGPEGKLLRIPIAQQEGSPKSAKQPGLKHKIFEKKTEDLEDFTQQVKELAQSYVALDSTRLQQAYQHGDVSLGKGGAPGEVQLVVRDYVKPGDSVALSLDAAQNVLRRMEISSYLSNPKDAVKVNAQFDRLPNGSSYLSEMLITGASKQLTVSVTNFDHQKI
jgi:hypothetical protein